MKSLYSEIYVYDQKGVECRTDDGHSLIKVIFDYKSSTLIMIIIVIIVILIMTIEII